MSFINLNDQGTVYAPGYFLAHEECVRETREIPQSMATTAADGSKYVKAGTVFPSNNGNAIGIVYEDVDVTTGNMPGSVVTKGIVYKDRLPATIDSSAVSALEALGFKFVNTSPAVTRPSWAGGSLTDLTVASSAGTAVGDTAVSVSGYTLGSSDGYVYKVAHAAADIKYGEKPGSTWNAWNGTSDITATTGKVITVAVVDADGLVVAVGSDTVTAKSA